MESFNDLIDEFYEEIKGDYTITKEELKRVCKSPFLFIKKTISSGEMKNIRIKYFGLFKANGRRVRYFYNHSLEQLKKGLITEEQMKIREQTYKNYIKNHEE